MTEMKNRKRALLGSVLALLLCIALFTGTTFAWFTDTVSSTGNQVSTGTLKVDLLYKGASLKDTDTAIFVSPEHGWEPGFVQFEEVTVVNKGSLHFQYFLSIAPQGTLTNLAEVVEVYVADITAGNTFDMTDREATLAAMTPAGTVADLMNTDGGVLAKGTSTVAKDATVATYAIALKLMESAGNEYQGMNLCDGGFNVTLHAVQLASESDDFGNDYDSEVDLPVANVADMLDKLAAGKNVELGAYVNISSAADRPVLDGGVFDGAGNTLAYTGDKLTSPSMSAPVLTVKSGTVKNLTIDASENGRALYINNTLNGDLNVENCVLDGAYSFNYNSSVVTNYKINFTNTVFKSWTSYANSVDSVNFTGCTFEGNLRPYATSVLTNCEFVGEGELDLSCLVAGETVTLIDCNLAASAITLPANCTLTENGTTITITAA